MTNKVRFSEPPNSKGIIEEMKSNQRWLKLRTTVQLSGALTSSMNRAKPTLKREDSFIKRFSTRQIAELQDTVDHTDEEDLSKTTTGCPKPRKKRKKKHPWTVINPYGNLYFYWLCVVTICVLYNLWTAIVRQAFPELQIKYQSLWFGLDALDDFIILMDILVQFRSGYLEQGLIVYDSKKLALHYMHSRNFILDIIALFPLDLLQIPFGMIPMLRFPRFLKVYRVYNYYYMVESRTLYPNMWRVANLVHILLLLAHWFGCFYYMLSEAEQFKGDWTYPYHYGADFKTLSRKYLGSVYWSTLTLTTIGDLPTPESNKQYIFTIISYLIGVFIFATIVGQVGNVITNRNANRLEFERLLDGAKLYMRHHKVPREMQRRVQRWYDYSWSRGRIQGGGDINSALGLLPDKLRTELALHVNLTTLKKVSIFKECQPEFLHDLVLKMKAYIFTPGDLICRKGEVAREMFIIADGILEVISETGKVLTRMKAGDFFGEIGILNLDGLNKRTADVRSVGYSELFTLSREDVLAAMKDYPEAQEILQSLGRKRLMDARHQPSKSGSSVSSKGGSPTLAKDGIADDRNPRRIVSKLRSDVSAIRNAFRRSKGTTRDLETLELEPLTAEPKTGSLDNDTPAVKKILRRLGRDGSDPKSRGVLKRMPRVTGDEPQAAPLTTRAATEEGQGVLGAGLPLLQRLKLLKEKEDKEEKERMRLTENRALTKQATVQEPEKPVTENKEVEVIGKGLPLFARLQLLKAKEERERRERERERQEGEKLKEGDGGSSSDIVPKPRSFRKESLKRSQNEAARKEGETVKKEEESKKTEEKNNNKNEEIKTEQSAKVPTVVKVTEDASDVGMSVLNGKEATRVEKLLTVAQNSSQSLQIPNSQEKIQRNESFKKAMEEGILQNLEDGEKGESEEPKSNENQTKMAAEEILQKRARMQKVASQMEPSKLSDSSLEDGDNSSESLKAPEEDQSPSLSSSEGSETLERKNLKSILKKISKEEEEQQLTTSKNESSLRRLMKAPTIEGFAARRCKLNKTVSFQRKTLSSPPVMGFLHDLRNRYCEEMIHSEPEMSSYESALSREARSPDGVSKLLSKLSTVGETPIQNVQVDELVKGDDVELAWGAKIDNLRKEIIVRDATIKHLTETVLRLQQRISGENTESLNAIEFPNQDATLQKENTPPSPNSSDSDEDEPLFMRCNSVESIIHHSPNMNSPIGGHHHLLSNTQSWPNNVQQEEDNNPKSWNEIEIPRKKYRDVVLDFGESSTDDDIRSLSSEEGHVFGHVASRDDEHEESFNEEELEEEPELEDEADDDDDDDDLEIGEVQRLREADFNSQDWEVQMLAQQLAEEQRGVARKVDKDIACGMLDSSLAELHEALATDSVQNLTEMELAHLEKIIRQEREKLRKYARMYSLEERPVLEDEFCSLYRSRSQMLLNRSSELVLAGPIQRRLSRLLKQLVKLPPIEQFLLDRLVYKKARSRRLRRQRSLCDDQLSSYDTNKLSVSFRNRKTATSALRRSMSACSPPPSFKSLSRTISIALEEPEMPPGFYSDNPEDVTVMLASLQKSVTAISSRSRSPTNGMQEGQTLLEGQPLLPLPR